MKKIFIMLISVFLFSALFAAEQAEIVYIEGKVQIKAANNTWYVPDFGDPVKKGDTVITGADGYLEVQSGSNLIKIAADTIFTFMESEAKSKKRDVFTCISGSVLFKIAAITGTAPEINTLVASAGVRGTEFSLFAADNGVSLVLVAEGTVEVSAAGASVEIAADEGVEVQPGSPPGAKFKVLRGMVNFKEWNNDKIGQFLDDPAVAVHRLYTRMQAFVDELKKIESPYNTNKQLLALERKNLDAVNKKEGSDAGKVYYKEKVLPLEVETSYQFLNMRYYVLSALSLRRYVLSRLYLLMKVKYTADYTNQVYRDYLYAHNEALKLFEEYITPYLVAADI